MAEQVLDILILEPYAAGSHLKWLKGIQQYSSHRITAWTLPGVHWKWRMHGAAITFAQQYKAAQKKFDLILCSDMMDVAVFKSLIEPKEVKIGLYFHENQLTYPWHATDPDLKLERNIQYGYINYTSALAADFVWFNSVYHRNSFLQACKEMLEKFPDHRNLETIDILEKKSKVQYFGIDITALEQHKPALVQKGKDAVLLWNHRWEYDKNPELFFSVLFKLKERGVRFKVMVLGESFTKIPPIFNQAKEVLQEEILHWGYCEKASEYYQYLYQSDILLVANKQDFFGISILEAMSCGVFPLLPNRLSYPEFFPEKIRPTFIYDHPRHEEDLLKELTDRLQRLIFDIKYPRGMNLMQWVQPFQWEARIKEWDADFTRLKSAFN